MQEKLRRSHIKSTIRLNLDLDQVRIEGDPVIESRIAGGVSGDVATCAITLNAVRSVLEASPGLKTMAQIPPIGFYR